MNWKNKMMLLICIVMFSCNDKEKGKSTIEVKEPIEERSSYFNTNHIIEAIELKKIVRASNTKIIHFGKPEEYVAGHIVGALNIWRTDIEDASYNYKGIMASKLQIEKLFSRLGISNNDMLIVYDSVASCDAARLWWLLKNYGFNKVKILNGGIEAWKKSNGELTTTNSKVTSTKFKLPTISPMSLYASKEEVLKMLSNSKNSLIIDTRTTNEFSGKRQKNGAQFGGRISNSVLIDWANSVNYNSDQKFKSYSELLKIYKKTIPNQNDAVIVYCHSGVRSAHTTFVLTELLGYNNVKNYDGSWIEWSHFKNYPKEKDSITSILK